jgi:hypothetical protein
MDKVVDEDLQSATMSMCVPHKHEVIKGKISVSVLNLLAPEVTSGLQQR